jgi:CDP-paratose 2-epimerase
MKVLITGIAGFVGSSIAKQLVEEYEKLDILGIDNLSRKGSERNLDLIRSLDIRFFHGDIRSQSDVDCLPAVDWVIDCAANPSVLAGLDGKASSRQVLEHNLLGTINLLEYCKRRKTGFTLVSTSRVYSAMELANLSVKASENRYHLHENSLTGLSALGISEQFPTTAPVSLYGASKLASEQLILEYGHVFEFPVWINRCGVLAGAGQFGKADQGIFSFWIHSFKEKSPLNYIGFGGSGYQVRDALHPIDLVPILTRQIQEPAWEAPKIVNLGGGLDNALSLCELTDWCTERFGGNEVLSLHIDRPMDAPWIVMDSTLAQNAWNWRVKTNIYQILEEIADHADRNPKWLKSSY